MTPLWKLKLSAGAAGSSKNLAAKTSVIKNSSNIFKIDKVRDFKIIMTRKCESSCRYLMQHLPTLTLKKIAFKVLTQPMGVRPDEEHYTVLDNKIWPNGKKLTADAAVQTKESFLKRQLVLQPTPWLSWPYQPVVSSEPSGSPADEVFDLTAEEDEDDLAWTNMPPLPALHPDLIALRELDPDGTALIWQESENECIGREAFLLRVSEYLKQLREAGC